MATIYMTIVSLHCRYPAKELEVRIKELLSVPDPENGLHLRISEMNVEGK